MHKVHFLVGVNLTGGIPLIKWMGHIGLLGKTVEPLLHVMEGWTSLVELTVMFTCPDSIALLVKGCGTRLLIGKAGSFSSGSFEVKELWEYGGTIPAAFHYLPSASYSKWEGWDLGLIMDLILLSMELSGNLIQYDPGSLASWSTTPVFYTFPVTSFMNTGWPGSSSILWWFEVLGCLLSNS